MKGATQVHGLREWSFSTLGTGADDFWQGYETFSHHSVGVSNFKKTFLWDTKLFCCSLKKCLCFCKVCDIYLLNEALEAYLHNIQHPKL